MNLAPQSIGLLPLIETKLFYKLPTQEEQKCKAR